MCDWEEFIFGCSCSYTKRKNYCHFARNDPNHQCFGVQVLKKVWDVPEICDKCSQRNNRTSTRSYQPYGQDPICPQIQASDVDKEPHGYGQMLRGFRCCIVCHWCWVGAQEDQRKPARAHQVILEIMLGEYGSHFSSAEADLSSGASGFPPREVTLGYPLQRRSFV
ncbi:hypothetical protein N8I77_002165 [Diaporthe amygdali]|uniref:Uncharacterized protein n=1 Tax=Phomopsis amygdali TaxID=1214568 RepID=A0AAD9W8U4_PHOAM|nr:hypothetical protein N8I77_002165 [Diaporthe amygdali]